MSTSDNQAYLDDNKGKEGVQVTESGLQYRVLESGEGGSPAPSDLVTVHYAGRLVDGNEFDSSYKRGEPAQFPVNRVIPGWQEALQLMKVGDKFELVIPSELAYGEQGAGGVIPGGATLIFEVEMLEFMSEADAKAAQDAQFESFKNEQFSFLDENASKEGVSVTESGLQYKVLTEGTGKKPADEFAKVTVHYEGKLINGEIFDSSYQRGETIQFGLNQVIKGWTEGVQLMNEGATYELYIPHHIGYGERGSGGSIPPFATLIFKVELVSVDS
jgi:FKBP-type peptidyl-prolyl cis-trans isomerase